MSAPASTEATVTLAVVSQKRDKVGDVQVPAALVAGPVREHLLYEMVKSQRASRRRGTHSTKTRHFVSGGGKKPWKQKGTGRARAGSSRSPIWVGGAVVFGPQPRSYDYRLPRSARRAAVRSAVAARHAEGKLLVVDTIGLAEPKTKRMLAWLEGLDLAGSVLIVLGRPDQAVERGARNLPHVKVIPAAALNVYDVLGHAHLVLTREAIEQLAARLGEEA